MSDAYLKELSPAQRAVVEYREGPLLVAAGPGSGKTRALTFRTAHLVHQGVAPQQILVVTFTNRAAREFRERLHLLLGEPAARLWMHTLHSTGVKVLRRFGPEGGFPPDFIIYDTGDQKRTLRRILRELGEKKDEALLGKLLAGISYQKEQLLPDQKLEDPLLAQVYPRYCQTLAQSGAFDFSDLIVNTVYLLRKAPWVREALGFQQILVDEFQDTDPSQWEMLKRLTPTNGSICCVGDIDQAVYSFRGAQPEIMLRFQEHFPGGKVLPLGQNFRSYQTIVRASHALVSQNTQRINQRLWSERPPGSPILIQPCFNPDDEAWKIGQKIGLLHQAAGLPWREIAILYRTGYQSGLFEQQLLRRGIPYHVHGTRFFERAEIRDVIGYLRLIYRPDDWLAFANLAERAPRAISKSALEKLEGLVLEEGLTREEALPRLAKLRVRKETLEKLERLETQVRELSTSYTSLTLGALIRRVFIDTELMGYYKSQEDLKNQLTGDCYTDNLLHLAQLAEVHYPGSAGETLPPFLEYASLMGEKEEGNNRDAVQLLTMHAAKGTEYRAVLVAGVEEDLLPHWRSVRSANPEAGIEEERRLLYVAMTRAKENLFLYHCVKRWQGDQEKEVRPSRFLSEIPRDLCKLSRLGSPG